MIARTRVHHQPRGLVDDEDRLILVSNLKRHGLRRNCVRGRFSYLQLDRLTTNQTGTRFQVVTVYRNLAGFKPLGQAAARMLREHFCQRLVQSYTGQMFRDDLFQQCVRHGGTHEYGLRYGILAGLDFKRQASELTAPGRYMAQHMLKILDQYLAVQINPAPRLRWLAVALAATLLAGCGGDREQRTQFQTAQEYYDRAQNAMNSGNYRQAILIFEQLESRYPFSTVGKQSQIDLIYCYYKNGSQEQALDAADQFMRENPTHPRVDYALYVKGLALFDRPPGALDNVLRIDRNDRPPNNARQAFSVFRQLVERYPASDYADDAVQRMRYIKDKLARYENLVADYYLRMGAWVAALNRAKGSLEAYDGTEANKRSLEIMIEAYDQLGLTDLAENSRQVLAENFPST